MTHAAGAVLAAGSPFEAPGPNDFFRSGNTLWWNSSILLVLAGVLVLFFYGMTSARRGLVPNKLQFAGESLYSFVRDGIARDTIGEHDFIRYVPLLVTSFTFILINNLFGMIPFLQFPTFARASFAYTLAALVWLIYNGVGVMRHGPVRYLKNQTVPSGVPGWILPLLVPLEFLSNILIRPITLSLRLFANMFAGHLLIILFSTGGWWLLHEATGTTVVLKSAGVLSFLLGILVGFLEIVVEFLQAYVFTLLAASYISGALAAEH